MNEIKLPPLLHVEGGVQFNRTVYSYGPRILLIGRRVGTSVHSFARDKKRYNWTIELDGKVVYTPRTFAIAKNEAAMIFTVTSKSSTPPSND
jgi:hypothetical protein